jgi:hypothetical protein
MAPRKGHDHLTFDDFPRLSHDFRSVTVTSVYDTNRVTQWKGEKLNGLNTSTDAFYIL